MGIERSQMGHRLEEVHLPVLIPPSSIEPSEEDLYHHKDVPVERLHRPVPVTEVQPHLCDFRYSSDRVFS